jgi:DNA-binding GntR family transcriptional regulator
LISQETGYNRDTVFKSLSKLEMMGYIARRQGKEVQTRKFRQPLS